jgi:hypothetical protein
MSNHPEMSRQEASWHEHLAGMRAGAKARKLGSNPLATDALATATAGPVEIGGFQLFPASEGTVWTLKRLAREFRSWADGIGMPSAGEGEANGTRELMELGLSTLVFCDSLRVWTRLEQGELYQLALEAEDLMFRTPIAITRQLEAHFQRQMQAIRDLTPDDEGTPGKSLPTGGSGISPGQPIPQEAADSPPSNGSLPSMGSPLKQPSGALRS